MHEDCVLHVSLSAGGACSTVCTRRWNECTEWNVALLSALPRSATSIGMIQASPTLVLNTVHMYILCTDSIYSLQCGITVRVWRCTGNILIWTQKQLQRRNAGPEAGGWNMCHSVTHAASHSDRHKSQALDQCPVSPQADRCGTTQPILFSASTVRRVDCNQPPSNINTSTESESAHWHSVVRGDSSSGKGICCCHQPM